MPQYTYECLLHGRFERIQPMDSKPVSPCPDCGTECDRVMSVSNHRIVWKRDLPLGNKSPGKFISHQKTGGSDIYIPSMGAVEQEEIDDVALAAIDKEQTIVRNGGRQSETKQKISACMELAQNTKPGQRAKVIGEFLKQKERVI